MWVFLASWMAVACATAPQPDRSRGEEHYRADEEPVQGESETDPSRVGGDDRVVAPLAGSSTAATSGPEGGVRVMAPLQGSPKANEAEPAPRVAMPLARLPGPADPGRPPDVTRPLGEGPPPKKDAPPDPRTIALVRLDFMLGPVWRVREVDAMLTTSVEIGQMHGLSGAFHTSLIVVTNRNGVEAFDVPIGVGAIARGKLRNRSLFGSVGASAGVLVHRANTERGVVHRVDPDFRVPIRLAWTAKVVGLSVAVVQGYSVRDRIYERRGNVTLRRHAYRVGLLIGLHFDMLPGWPMKPLRRR